MPDEKLKPPPDYKTWLDFAVENMPTRELFLEWCFVPELWGRVVQRADFESAARQELDELRAQAAGKDAPLLSPISIFPHTIVSDRYGGLYSNGRWTAWPLAFDEIPAEIKASDIECAAFWGKHTGRVGKGNTPEEALRDLALKCANGEESGLVPTAKPAFEPRRADPPAVVSVKAGPDFMLLLEFANGELRIFDMTKHLERERWQPLQDLTLFSQAYVDNYTVVWPGDIEMPLLVLYAGAKPL